MTSSRESNMGLKIASGVVMKSCDPVASTRHADTAPVATSLGVPEAKMPAPLRPLTSTEATALSLLGSWVTRTAVMGVGLARVSTISVAPRSLFKALAGDVHAVSMSPSTKLAIPVAQWVLSLPPSWRQTMELTVTRCTLNPQLKSSISITFHCGVRVLSAICAGAELVIRTSDTEAAPCDRPHSNPWEKRMFCFAFRFPLASATKPTGIST
mmetsp:Transcript_118480/g.271802  ORF Transcript_118480/g.271802 Transcript_118480/m.271802 type:complete len:212 (+) Transcript_118480:2313-2948(+)